MESDEGQILEFGLIGSEDLKVQKVMLYQSSIRLPADSIHAQSSDPRKWSMKDLGQPVSDASEDDLQRPQKVIRSRDRKFHKRFKNLPESEKVLKVYHCAYVSDILLQGFLYVTTETFCFYSKILGRERQIEIPISEVIDVTREKTAFIIPNAIGIQTSDSSKVFRFEYFDAEAPLSGLYRYLDSWAN